MSRPIGFLVLVGLALAAASTAEGQDLALTARRVDSTLTASVKARDALVAYRKAHPASYGDYTDSVVIAAGAVKVLFNAPQAALARAGAAEAEQYLADFGSAMRRIQPLVFSIVPDTAITPWDDLGRGAVNVRQHSAGDPARPNRTSTPGNAKSIALVITSAVSTTVTFTAASAIAAWNGGPLQLAARLNPKPDWDALRLSVVSSPSFTGRACYQGDIPACRLFLALDTVADPARMLFDSAGRYAIVGYEIERVGRASRVAAQRCLDGNDEACIAVLNMARLSWLASPFVRASVITRALEIGGARSVERLLSTPGSTKDPLAAAANQPIDSVVADWQRHLSERSAGSRLPILVVISSLAWIAVCVFLSLRSSRWR